jgi:hypothetical protein
MKPADSPRSSRFVVTSIVLFYLSCVSSPVGQRHAVHPRTSETAIVTNVCAITSDPRSFNNRRVTVFACIAADDHEYRFLFNQHSECGGPGLVPRDASGEVSASLRNGDCGTFTGVYHWDPQPFITYQKHVLSVETVTGLHNENR